MQTELLPCVGVNLATKKEQVHEQSFVHYKGRRVGLVGWKDGDSIIFTEKLSPFDAEIVRSQVSKLLEREADFVNAPELIDVQTETPTEDTYDEFNESDLT